MSALPTLGGDNGAAAEINNRGQVAGQAENTVKDSTCVAPQVLQFKPVLWEKGAIEELPTFSGDPDGVATAINDKGQTAGASGTCAMSIHALLWQNGTATDLGNLGGTMNNAAIDTNNQGQVVGFSNLPGNTIAHAFLWQNGVMTDLNTLIPAGSPLFLIEATGTINSRGQIAGIALQISTSQLHAFLATPSNSSVGSGNATPAAAGETSQSPRVVLTEHVRRMLRERMARRYPYRGFGVWPLK